MTHRIHGVAPFAAAAAAIAAAAIIAFTGSLGAEPVAPAPVDPATVDIAAFDKLWDYDRPDSSERRFTSILSRAAAAGDTAAMAEILSQVARAQGLQGRFDAAHATLDRAEGYLSSGMEIPRIRVLLERGRAFNSSGSPSSARPLFLEAWQKASAAGADFHAVDAAHMMGIIEPDSAALTWNERALAVAEASKDARARGWLGALYNNAGWVHHDAGRPERALELFTKALAFRIEKAQEPEARIARWCIARCKRSLGRVGEALQEQQALLAELEKIGNVDGYVHEEIAECFTLLGREDQARPHFARAHEILSEDSWFVANEPDRLARMRSLGRVP